MHKITLIGLWLCVGYAALSQPLKRLSIEDVSTNYALYARELPQMAWIPNTDLYSYVNNGRFEVYDVDGKLWTAIGLEDINKLLGDAEQLSRLPYITWHSQGVFSFTHLDKVFLVDEGKQAQAIIQLPSGYANLEYDQATRNYSFTVGNSLYVNGVLLAEGTNNMVYGQSVHRNEFGIGKGTFWSNDYGKLAFYANDQSAVSDYPIMDIQSPVAQANTIKYPMAGQANEVVRLGVYSVAGNKTVYLETGDADQYLTNVSWDPNGKYVYVGVLNRGQDYLNWQQYDAATGKRVKTLMEERDAEYVEPLEPFIFNPENASEFIYVSMRDGYTHLYRYNTQGMLLNRITEGGYEVTDVLGFDADGKNVYYVSTQESPLERHIYRVSVKGGKPLRVSSEKGYHYGRVSATGKYVIDSYSSRTEPRKMELLTATGKLVRVLHQAPNPLEGYVMNEMEIGTIKAADHATDLYYRIIKPADFDPAKRYPVVQYVYGGPHAQMVSETWMGGASLFLHYLAQEGFVVFTLDNRGSDNRGADFEQVTHRRLGEVEMEDQLVGLEFLRSLPYVDDDRIGVHGWSYGGFMTTSLMLKKAGNYKMGVCGGPVIDWKFYEIMYTERYMDSPQENADGYAKASLLGYADKLAGKLLIVHGTADDVVVWQHSLALIDVCMQQGVLLDYMPYPGHGHHVGGSDRIHLHRYMAAYIKDNL
jgi:dipeptidyl-peptidase-4